MIRTIDWQGHRGCRGILPENCIPAFLKAIDEGVSTIEMDVVISGNGQVVVSHEPYFSYIISSHPEAKNLTEDNEKEFNLFDMPYEEIRSWDVGLKRHPLFPEQVPTSTYKPLLSEVILEVENYVAEKNIPAVNYSIELKCFEHTEGEFHPAPGAFADKVIEVIKSKNIDHLTVIQAFDKRVIEHLKTSYPEVKCSFLYPKEGESWKIALDEMLAYDIEVFGPNFEIVTAEMVEYAHSHGLKVIPWTINNLDQMEKLITLGVDGIITDFPNYLPLINPYLERNHIKISKV